MPQDGKLQLPKIKDLLAKARPSWLPTREQIMTKIHSVKADAEARNQAQRQKVKDAVLPDRNGLLRGILQGKELNYTASVANAMPEPTTTTPVAAPVVPEPPKPATFKVRDLDLTEDDFTEIRDIMYAEISNRNEDRQEFEVENIMNVAMNRALARKKSVVEILQEKNQFQGYAPKGMNVKGGKVVESQYQKVKAGKLTEADKKKLQRIEAALGKFKDGTFTDRSAGAQFYVHASDGTMWFGKTVQEAKKNALAHEQENALQRTQFGTAVGLPVH